MYYHILQPNNPTFETFTKTPKVINVEEYHGVYADEPIELQINWSAKGDVDLDNAEKFAEGLNRAIELARDFKYNGYMLEYC